MKQKFYDDSMSLNNSLNCCEQRICSEGDWTDGCVKTPYGIVLIQAQPPSSANTFTRLDFAYKHRLYIRTFSKFYSERGIAILAGRFAKEIVGRKSKKRNQRGE